MTLSQLKQLLGVEEGDTSQDYYLGLQLESALKAAEEYCDRLDFLAYVNVETGVLELPGPVNLGIYEWIKAASGVSKRGGVVSESIGGMSQSFADGAAVYSAAHHHWRPYHSDIKFLQIGRRFV